MTYRFEHDLELQYVQRTKLTYDMKRKKKKNRPLCFDVIAKMLQTAQVSTISNPLSTETTNTTCYHLRGGHTDTVREREQRTGWGGEMCEGGQRPVPDTHEGSTLPFSYFGFILEICLKLPLTLPCLV